MQSELNESFEILNSAFWEESEPALFLDLNVYAMYESVDPL